jgi:hypothetical protein
VSDGVDNCAASVAAGQGNITLAAIGARTLTANHAGSTSFHSSTSSGAAHTVNPPSPPFPPSRPLAHIFSASVTHHQFRVSTKPQLEQISRRRPPVGTTVKYTLDRAAAVRFDFTQPSSGRKVNGTCVAPKTQQAPA